MSTRIVFLRAVNVGGAAVPMAELRHLATELGATNVSTYIASGNLICRPSGDPAVFDADLERAIEGRFGFFREAISRTPAQVAQALAAHPLEVIDPRFSYISFCRTTPVLKDIEVARRYDTGEDRWEVIGDDLHIRYAAGAGHAQMPTPAILRALKVVTTARNLRTVRKLLELAT